MPNNNLPRLRVFQRIDSKGRLILGSEVRRLHKPKQGLWKELFNSVCCDGILLTYAPVDASGTDFTLLVKCDATTRITLAVEGSATSVATLVDLLNLKASYLGEFTLESSTTIGLTLKKSIVDDLACTGTLSFTVED